MRGGVLNHSDIDALDGRRNVLQGALELPQDLTIVYDFTV